VRAEAQEELAKSKFGALNKIMPQYKFDERLKLDVEVDKPDPNLFIEVGYNKNPEDKVKHYRRYYNDELENN